MQKHIFICTTLENWAIYFKNFFILHEGNCHESSVEAASISSDGNHSTRPGSKVQRPCLYELRGYFLALNRICPGVPQGNVPRQHGVRAMSNAHCQ
jgi:hypothetical protein